MSENYLILDSSRNERCLYCSQTIENNKGYEHTNGNSLEGLSCQAHKKCIEIWNQKLNYRCLHCRKEIDMKNTFVTKEFVELKIKNSQPNCSNYVALALMVSLTVWLTFFTQQ